jgi:hypothetical protein
MRSQTTAALVGLVLAACSSASSPPDCTDCGGDSGAANVADSASNASADVSVQLDDAADSRPVEETDAADDGGAAEEQADAGCIGETERELCARENKNCGPFSANDRCGDWRTVEDCSFGAGCVAPQICGACNRCCTQETDAEFCARLGFDCGSTYAQDNCGHVRAKTSCGTCGAGKTCGGGGTPNVCGCSAESDAVSCAEPAPIDGGSGGD